MCVCVHVGSCMPRVTGGGEVGVSRPDHPSPILSGLSRVGSASQISPPPQASPDPCLSPQESVPFFPASKSFLTPHPSLSTRHLNKWAARAVTTSLPASHSPTRITCLLPAKLPSLRSPMITSLANN